jgi:hypothetical protein
VWDVNVGGGVIALVVWMARIYSRLAVPTSKIWYDDFVITVAMVRPKKYDASPQQY